MNHIYPNFWVIYLYHHWNGAWIIYCIENCDINSLFILFSGNCLNGFSTLRPRQNGHHFTDIFKCIFLNENVWISISISLKFIPKGPINNIPSLVQIMVWCHPDTKPLSEPMMVSLLMNICVTSPQWVQKTFSPVGCGKNPRKHIFDC